MATTYHYFTGTVKWAKTLKPDEKYGNYSIAFYPDKETKKAIKDAGVPSKVKVDDETGEQFFTFRRPVSKEIKGELKEFGPPMVYNADGSPFEYKSVKDDKEFENPYRIGNGTRATVKLEVYDVPATGGKGSRLAALRIEELNEYIPEGGQAAGDLPF